MKVESLYNAMNGIDEEIIRRNGEVNRIGTDRRFSRKLTYKVIAAVAAVAITLGGVSLLKPWKTGEQGSGAAAGSGNELAENSGGEAESVKSYGNMFVITAYAAEPATETQEGAVSSGDVLGISAFEASTGKEGYLTGRFQIAGKNIEKIRISTDIGELYTVDNIYETDPDYEKIRETELVNGETPQGEYYELVLDDAFQYDEEAGGDRSLHFEHYTQRGVTYEEAYDPDTAYGMYVPAELREELASDLSDQDYYHACCDLVDGATLTIAATFEDGTTEEHQYRLSTGRIYVPADEEGFLQWNNLTRFLTPEEEASADVPYTYGYLMKKMN